MKKIILTIFITSLSLLTLAQEVDKSKIKKGWNFGPFPAVGYSSDLGFQYGAMCDFYFYGDGSHFPQYLHKLNAEVSFYTKGSMQLHAFYDSKFLIPKLRTTFAATYISDAMNDFYGFNGYSAPYFSTKDVGNYYRVRRDLLRIIADFQGSISGHWGWALGMSFWGNNISDVKLKAYKDVPSLYTSYVNKGIIPFDQRNGGKHIELKAGIVYDTRDHEPDPSKGMCMEAILYGSPDIIENHGDSYLNLSMVFRHYIPIVPKRLTAAYRIAYQGVIAGSMPFYMQQNITLLYLRRLRSEGLGGSTTIRGVLRNRIGSNGYGWANVELRYRMFNFRLLKQNWYMAVNPFFDAGLSLQPYRLSAMKATEDPEIYSGSAEGIHCSAGVGLKAVMNNNFILSAEWGKAFDSRDGNNGLAIGLNYVF